MRRTLFLAIALLAARSLGGQTFEVASVKPNPSSDPRDADMKVLAGGKVTVRNVPLVMIVAAAWNVPFQSPRLTGGRQWQQMMQERFDIEASPPEGVVAPGLTAKERGDLVRPMMQALLEDRFKLKMRQDAKEQPVYALVVAKDGPKLQKAAIQEKDCENGPPDQPKVCHHIGGGQGRGIHGEAIGIDDVALFVQNWTDRPVVDKTGLTGLFNIQTEGWTPMRLRPPNPDGTTPKGDAGINDGDRQTLFDVFHQLGLAMESQRAVVDMYVIEHIERPIPN